MDRLPSSMEPKLWLAADLFARHGLDATKMEDVAKVTGIPKATLYYHFAGKEAVLGWIFQALLREVEDVVVAAVNSDGTAAQRLRVVIKDHLQLFHRRRHASAALQFDLGRAARSPEIRDAVDASFVKPVADLIAHGIKERSLTSGAQPRSLAIALLGALNSTGMQLPATSASREVAEAADVLADLILEGLST